MITGWRFLGGVLILLMLCAPEGEAQRKRNGKGGGRKNRARKAADQGISAVSKATRGASKKARGAKSSQKKGRSDAGGRNKAEAAAARRPMREVKRTPIRDPRKGGAGRLQGRLAGKESVRYQISGGVVGLDLELIIVSDGRAALRDHGKVTREASFGKKGYAKLQKSLKAAGLSDARSQYGARDASGRRTLKSLVVSHGNKTIKISSYDDPLDPAPDEVRRQFELFDKLLASNRLKARTPPTEEFVTVDGFSVTTQINQHLFSLPSEDDLIPEAETLEATLALVNAASDPLQLHFMSDKRFDFAIRDSQSNVMRRWSDGKTFSQVPQTATIGGENRLLFVARLPLSDRNGEILPAGTYSLEYELFTRGDSMLSTSESSQPEGEAPFVQGTIRFRIQPFVKGEAKKEKKRVGRGRKGKGKGAKARGQRQRQRAGNARGGANQRQQANRAKRAAQAARARNRGEF